MPITFGELVNCQFGTKLTNGLLKFADITSLLESIYSQSALAQPDFLRIEPLQYHHGPRYKRLRTYGMCPSENQRRRMLRAERRQKRATKEYTT